ncbi:arsenate reductase (glutaredoxin) [Roseivirga thermotolerans]|uniref:Arsenate reductase (Glutaredoxin) n=1 Tax=Roseivirga thermotolerans TaxID=1758176 RepID=A0ABQ3I2Z1_9BACT|nr:arsenate reductase (glutaredoxin) [Roseivirga thermotolerans]GHE59749.1 arsenate reductase (glutaredoxin) [Roseivirga thermotolerans]
MLKIFHNPRCTKSRETLKIIEESGEMVEVVEYLKTVPSEEELTDLVKLLGISPEELVRKGEAIYKEEFKGKLLSDEEWIKAMVMHPKLIERPIVVKGNKAIIGRPPEKVRELI